MRGVLLLLMLTIPALFVFGCVANDVAEPAHIGVVTATGSGRNYQLSINDKSGLSYREIIAGLREFSRLVDAEKGLTGRDETNLSQNTAQFSSGPEVSFDAPSKVLELLVAARIYKLNAHLVLSDGSTYSRLLKLPTDDGLSSAPDYTDKIQLGH